MNRRARIAAFLVGAVALQVSPFAVQVLYLRAPMLLGWQMFDRKGAHLCEVHYEARTGDSVRKITIAEIVDRHRTPRRQAIFYRVETPEKAVALGMRECAALPAGTELRAVGRCGDRRGGWKPLSGEDLCRSAH